MKKFAAIALAASMVLGSYRNVKKEEKINEKVCSNCFGCQYGSWTVRVWKQRICPDQRHRHSGASNLFFPAVSQPWKQPAFWHRLI